MAHQYKPKIFHDPCKNPSAIPPTYLMHGTEVYRYREIGIFKVQ